jgi:hypothetical protein
LTTETETAYVRHARETLVEARQRMKTPTSNTGFLGALLLTFLLPPLSSTAFGSSPDQSLADRDSGAPEVDRAWFDQLERIEPGDAYPLPLASREDFVPYFYAWAEKAIRLAGYDDFELEVDSLHTVQNEEFDQTLYWDVVTDAGGKQLDIEPIFHSVTFESATGTQTLGPTVTFQVSWQEGADWRVDQPWGGKALEELKGLTVREALKRSAKEEEAPTRIVALTTFQVELEFEGESRVYRAAFLWKGESGNRSPDTEDFLWIDNVVPQIDTTITELPIRHHDLDFQKSHNNPDPAPAKGGK